MSEVTGNWYRRSDTCNHGGPWGSACDEASSSVVVAILSSVVAASAGELDYEHAVAHADWLCAYSGSDMLYNRFHIYDTYNVFQLVSGPHPCGFADVS